jgi:Na+-transporting methylmalonyl-CoA/oxaloacetate decarboxylase gamma subunit
MPTASVLAQAFEIYDPLIPQSFAFDKRLGIFAGINNVDNEIVIVSHHENEDLYISHRFLVDKVTGRHDSHHIFRPKSVAIYDGFVAFLASHRDSCYFAVLNTAGVLEKRLTFPGFASAFSYSPTANELYISGDNITGFDVIVLDTHNGINQVAMKEVSTLHYQKPRMSEEIAIRDSVGVVISVIAMSVVFIALILLYLIFRQVGVQLMAIQDRRGREHRKQRKHKHREKEELMPDVAALSSDISGDICAAITAAIYLYNEELHDVENAVLTINKVSRTYSPWSSKIHGLNTYFNKR